MTTKTRKAILPMHGPLRVLCAILNALSSMFTFRRQGSFSCNQDNPDKDRRGQFDGMQPIKTRNKLAMYLTNKKLAPFLEKDFE